MSDGLYGMSADLKRQTGETAQMFFGGGFFFIFIIFFFLIFFRHRFIW